LSPTRKSNKWSKGRRTGQARPRPARSTSTHGGGAQRSRPRGRKRRGLSAGAKAAIAVGVGVVALVAVYVANGPGGSSGGAGEFAYAVGSPGPGEQAPSVALSSTDGDSFDLASMQGRTVMLYFQEGLMCQPCWDQIVDIEAELDRFRDLGIDELVTITTDPLDALRQKVIDEGITTPVLSDPDLAVSHTYDTNSYGMMGDSRNGHTFIVVGPDGSIRWRADYGGAPDYTMYLPVDSLLSDLRQGLQEA
jgi:peroxiredoxin